MGNKKNLEKSLIEEVEKRKKELKLDSGLLNDKRPGWSSPCVRGMVYDKDGTLIPMDLEDNYRRN